MDDTTQKLAALNGLTTDDLEPKPDDTGERLDNLEATADDIILMMADLIGGETK
nr:MAG TPA: hypothetical protein [Caudoviricetes sp.]